MLQLNPNGTLVMSKPGPTDQTQESEGTWKLQGQKLKLSPQGEGARVLEIESVEPDRMVVRKSSSNVP